LIINFEQKGEIRDKPEKMMTSGNNVKIICFKRTNTYVCDSELVTIV